MNRNLFSVAMFASFFIPGLVVRADAQCSNATLKGTYILHTEATVLPAGTKRVNLTQQVYDGEGGFTSRFTVNDNGVVSRGFIKGLTYQINEDCRGMTFDDTGAEQGDLLVQADGNEFAFIRTNPPTLILLGFGKRQQ